MTLINTRLGNLKNGQYLTYSAGGSNYHPNRYIYIFDITGDEYRIIYNIHSGADNNNITVHEYWTVLLTDRTRVSQGFNAVVFELSEDEYLIELAGHL